MNGDWFQEQWVSSRWVQGQIKCSEFFSLSPFDLPMYLFNPLRTRDGLQLLLLKVTYLLWKELLIKCFVTSRLSCWACTKILQCVCRRCVFLYGPKWLNNTLSPSIYLVTVKILSVFHLLLTCCFNLDWVVLMRNTQIKTLLYCLSCSNVNMAGPRFEIFA